MPGPSWVDVNITFLNNVQKSSLEEAFCMERDPPIGSRVNTEEVVEHTEQNLESEIQRLMLNLN